MDPITVETTVDAPVGKVWSFFNDPAHITGWGKASEEWHTVKAANDLKEGGTFNYRMEARDGSQGFDFTGTYTEVVPHRLIRYTMSDGRKVSITFDEGDSQTRISETFDPEMENPVETQRGGWQAILDNFKSYVEGN